MMKRKSGIDAFESTNSLKVLSYLAANPGREFLVSEIQSFVPISRAGIYLALNELVRQKLVSKRKKGAFCFYSIVYDDSAIKQFKVLKSVLALRPLAEKLRTSAKKVILFGSTSRGENGPDSDIDLFILSGDPDASKMALSSVKTRQKIKAVIKTSAELSELKEKDKVFCSEVDRGIVIWEKKE